MQICAADSAGGKTHDGVVTIFNLWFFDVIESNISDAVKSNGFHHSG